MKKSAVILLLVLAGSSYTLTSRRYSVVNADGTVNTVNLQAFVDNVFNNYQQRQHNRFVTVPRPIEIQEGNIVFYSTSAQTCAGYTLQNGATFSWKLNP